MKNCGVCNYEAEDNVEVCPNCGYKFLRRVKRPNLHKWKTPLNKDIMKKDISILGTIFSLLIPLVGLVLFIIWFDNNEKRKAKYAGIAGLIGLIIGIILFS